MIDARSSLKKVLMGLSAAALMLVAAGNVRANPEVYEKVVKSTAWVLSTKGHGSGVLIDVEKKLLLTNYHVVENDSQVTVFFPQEVNGELVSKPMYYLQNRNLAIPGRVLMTDVRRDLALIELKNVPEGVQAVPLAAKSARPGESIHAIGNSGVLRRSDGTPEGALWRYSEGKVRQVYEAQMRVSSPDGRTSFEINAKMVESQVPTNGGDSGGPVVNNKGELVAVTQSEDTVRRLVTYSVDISEVKAFLAEYEKTGGNAKDEKPKTDEEPAKSSPEGGQKPARRNRPEPAKQ